MTVRKKDVIKMLTNAFPSLRPDWRSAFRSKITFFDPKASYEFPSLRAVAEIDDLVWEHLRPLIEKAKLLGWEPGADCDDFGWMANGRFREVRLERATEPYRPWVYGGAAGPVEGMFGVKSHFFIVFACAEGVFVSDYGRRTAVTTERYKPTWYVF
jgi:hypothetical protein